MAIEKALRWVAVGGVFAIPFIVFIVTPSFFFPFITGKNFAFRIIVEIAAGAWLALALLNAAYRPRRSWLLGAFAIFALVVALADAFGAYPFKSIWSNFERMDGWVTLAHLFLYFIVASSVLTERLWRALFHVSLAVAAVVSVHGLLQAAGVASLNPGFSSAARVDASFGNPIYLGIYMLFHVGIVALLWANAAHRGTRRRASLSILYGIAISLFTLVLLMTGTRGAMLGLIGGGALGVFLLALSSQEARRFAAASLAGLLIFAGGFWLARDAAWIQKVPGLNRLADISLDDATTKARFMNWGMAWQGVKERPILGWGQENYAVVFDKYYNPQMYAQEQWFDRVHNIFFDWLVAAGVLGLISYLALYVAAGRLLWRRGEGEDGGAFSPVEKSVLSGILAGYLVSIFFVFDNITSYVLFVSILAYIATRHVASASDARALFSFPTFPRNLAPAVALAAIALVWAGAWFVNARPAAASRALVHAIQPQQAGIEKNLEYFRESISYHTVGTQEAREQLTQVAAQLAQAEDIPDAVKLEFFAAGESEMRRMMEEVPLSARFPLFLGILYQSYGQYDKALEALARAHEVSPGKQTILFELGNTQFATGDAALALGTFRQAFELAPEFLTARIYYAAVAIRVGNDVLADELLAPAIEDGSAADPRIAAAYVTRGRYDKIIELWEAKVRATPNDAQSYFTLAAAHFEAGNSSRAIAALEELAAEVPSAKEQADSLIEQIQAGTLQL